MKKNGILNSDISRVLSYLGHTDTICIGDCGLPIPDDVERIDLALKLGTPSFMEVLKEVSQDMKIEEVYLANEIKDNNPKVLAEVEELIKSLNQEIAIKYIDHTELKIKTNNCKALIRTGEVTPYANIILVAGCIFA